ncbi:hypothetical protein EK21DRAFT_111966 [Setomelanomma holmii]|uniref:F-box domain-containing protein n=1 Tax=Setomelanomma holmii TaxID=210430 RepID=A0A9P4H990_9PLEO|nr:hypothetical protein EK21DRAFT_111966 [Setomelanomma holmii]
MAHNRATPALRLIPRFPNEVSDAILCQLEFADLFRAYFVSKVWQAYIDDTDWLSKKVFRLPKQLRNASVQTQRAYVAELWEKTYAPYPVLSSSDAVWSDTLDSVWSDSLGKSESLEDVWDAKWKEILNNDDFLRDVMYWLTTNPEGLTGQALEDAFNMIWSKETHNIAFSQTLDYLHVNPLFNGPNGEVHYKMDGSYTMTVRDAFDTSKLPAGVREEEGEDSEDDDQNAKDLREDADEDDEEQKIEVLTVRANPEWQVDGSEDEDDADYMDED